MSEEAKKSLSQFMKKQISEKSSKNNSAKNSTAAQKSPQKKSTGTDQDAKNDKMSEEEQLAEAKKASRNKAAQRDQSEMLKKLFLENIAKYVLLITLLVGVSIAIIEFGPAFFKFLNGLIFRTLMWSIAKQ